MSGTVQKVSGIDLGSLYEIQYLSGECKYLLHDQHDDTMFVLDAVVLHAQLGAYFSEERAKRIIDKLVSHTPVIVDFHNAKAGVKKSRRLNGRRAASMMVSPNAIETVMAIESNPLVMDKNAAIDTFYGSMIESLFEEKD